MLVGGNHCTPFSPLPITIGSCVTVTVPVRAGTRGRLLVVVR